MLKKLFTKKDGKISYGRVFTVGAVVGVAAVAGAYFAGRIYVAKLAGKALGELAAPVAGAIVDTVV